MSDATCSLPDCDKPVYQTRPMCASHYMKNWRYGDPYFKQTIKFRDLTGQRFGALTPLRRAGSSKWVCRCDCGAETTANTGDLNRGNALSCGNARIHWRTSTPNYQDVHQWLRNDRGPASAYPCVDCGDRAREWSYDNCSADERTEVVTGRRPMRYSTDQAHYQPRCTPCHKQFDMDDRARRGEPIVAPRGPQWRRLGPRRG